MSLIGTALAFVGLIPAARRCERQPEPLRDLHADRVAELKRSANHANPYDRPYLPCDCTPPHGRAGFFHRFP